MRWLECTTEQIGRSNLRMLLILRGTSPSRSLKPCRGGTLAGARFFPGGPFSSHRSGFLDDKESPYLLHLRAVVLGTDDICLRLARLQASYTHSSTNDIPSLLRTLSGTPMKFYNRRPWQPIVHTSSFGLASASSCYML